MNNFLDKREYFENLWGNIKVVPNTSFKENAVIELKEYFNYDDKKIEFLLNNGETLLNKEWHDYFNNSSPDSKKVISFYDQSDMEIFELMGWHYLRYKNGPLQYVYAIDVAKERGYKDYLDYGCGIGTGGILFALNEFRVSLGDISTKNLDFCKFRFKRRGLNCNFIDFKVNKPAHNQYDIITCFDVLEHVWDPVDTLKTLRIALKDNGLLIVTLPFYKDNSRPMHIITDSRVRCKIRSLGFSYDMHLFHKCRQEIGRDVFFLSKKIRSKFHNVIYLFYDYLNYILKKTITMPILIFKKHISIKIKHEVN